MSATLNLILLILASLLSVVVALLWFRVRQQRLSMGAAVPLVTVGRQWWQTGVRLWNEEIRTHEGHMMQVLVSFTGVAISVSLGYIYAGHLWVQGWQLWTWLIVVMAIAAVLVPSDSFPGLPIPHWRWLLALAMVALALRLVLLESIPGLLHVDEMGSADFPMRHLYIEPGLTLNPFRTGASSQPALYHYITRLFIETIGYSITAIRISSVIVGTLAVLATYAVVAVLQERRTALIAAAIMTTYHYHVHWSRIALNNVWDTLWVPLTLAAFAWGWRKGWSGGAVIAGLALGFSQYFYAGSKVGIFLLAYVVYLLYAQTPNRRRLLVHGGKLVATAVTVAAPITLFALLEPATYFLRSREVMGWQEQAVVTTVGEYNLWRYLWHQLWHNLGAFTTTSDITGFYGPGIPFLIGLAAPLFVVGLLWSLWKRNLTPVLWVFLTTLLGGILMSGAPSSSHYIVSIPAICWLTAVPINWLWQRGRWRLAMLILAVIMLTDLLFYFVIYVPSAPRDLIHPLPPLPDVLR